MKYIIKYIYNLFNFFKKLSWQQYLNDLAKWGGAICVTWHEIASIDADRFQYLPITKR